MIGTSSYVTSMKKGRAIGGCLCSGSGGGGVTSLNGETGAITIIGTGDTTVTNVGTVFTINSAGGSGGPFLPLAGGVMDALPAGTITAHTIDGIASLTGIGASAPGNTFVIQTDPVGDNILIDATPSGGTVDINAFSTTIESSINALTGLDVQGAVVIQPIPAYTYPDNDGVVGTDNNIALHVKNWTNPNVAPTTAVNEIGIRVDNITSTNDNAIGMDILNIDGPAQAYGLQMNTVNSTGASFGVDMTNITGDGQVTGFQANTITTTAGQAFGMILNGMAGPNGAVGITLGGIDAQSNPGSFAQATGIQCSGVNGDGSAFGMLMSGVDATINPGNGAVATGIALGGVTGDGQTSGMVIQKILGKNANPVRGIEMFDIRGDDANLVGGNDVVGIEIREVEDSVGNGNSTGITVSKITNPLNSSQSKGISIDNIFNNVAKGLEIGSVTGQVNVPVGPDGARGVDITSITTPQGECYGLKIDNVAAGDGVTPLGSGRAFGINVDNVTGTSRCFGIRVGPNMTAPVGLPKIAFKQQGGTGITNEFDNTTFCGGGENVNSGQSLKIVGNAFYKAQYFNIDGSTILGNGGNLVIFENNTGIPITVFLPSGPNLQEGHQYTLCMSGTGDVKLDGAGNAVNANPNILLTGITLPNYQMYQAFYTTIAGGPSQWYVG